MFLRPVKAEPRSRRAGFLLMEVLVAGVVAVVLLVALLRAFGSTWMLNSRVREEAEAMIVARAVLERAGASRDNLAAGEQSGTAGRYEWALAVGPVEVEKQVVEAPPPSLQQSNARAGTQQPAREAERGPQWQLYSMVVSVRAPSGRRTVVETLRLGPVLQ